MAKSQMDEMIEQVKFYLAPDETGQMRIVTLAKSKLTELKEWYRGLDDREKKEIALVGGLILFLFLLLEIADSPRQYLGTWKVVSRSHFYNIASGWFTEEAVDMSRFTIEPLEDGSLEPRDELNLRKGQEAELLLPVQIRTANTVKYGGIYEIEGHHALVYWWGLTRTNWVFWIKREGGDLILGYSNEGKWHYSDFFGPLITYNDPDFAREKKLIWIRYAPDE